MKKECKHCKKKYHSELKKCPYCGGGDISFIYIIIVVALIIQFMFLAVLNSTVDNKKNNNSSINISHKQTNEIKKEEPTTSKKEKIKKETTTQKSVKSVKTYKITNKNFLTYLKGVAKKVYEDNNNVISSCTYTPYACTYYKIDCYMNQEYDENTFYEVYNKINNYIFDELNTNKYKSGSIFKCNYETLQFQLWNANKVGNTSNHDFTNFEVLDVNKYKTFDEYKNRLK